MKFKEIKKKMEDRIGVVAILKLELIISLFSKCIPVIRSLIVFLFLIYISVITSTYIVEGLDSNLSSENKIYGIYDYGNNYPYEIGYFNVYVSKRSFKLDYFKDEKSKTLLNISLRKQYKNELDGVMFFRTFIFILSLILLTLFIKRKHKNISESGVRK